MAHQVGDVLRASEPVKVTAVVLKDMSILEVKRDGVLGKKHFATYADWLATLSEGVDVVVTPSGRSAPKGEKPELKTDVDRMLSLVKYCPLFRLNCSLNELYEHYKQQSETPPLEQYRSTLLQTMQIFKKKIDAVGGPESEKANEKKLRISRKPFWILFSDGSKPEALYFGKIIQCNPAYTKVSHSEPMFFYKGKQGQSFAEVGVPVGENGWPNLWKIHGGEFKRVVRP